MKKHLLFLTIAILALINLTAPTTAQAQESFPPLQFSVDAWDFEFSGFLRAGYDHYIHEKNDYYYIPKENERKGNLVTPMSAFHLRNARLNFEVAYDDFVFAKTSLDMEASIDHKGEKEFSIDAADIYVELAFFKALNLRIGYYKPPFDSEALESETAQRFVSDSIASTGYFDPNATEPKRIDGFAPGRRLGISILSDLIAFENVGLNYHVSLTQADSIKIDDKVKTALAVYGRLEFHLLNNLIGEDNDGSFLSFAAAAQYKRQAVQEPYLNDYVTKDVPTWGLEFAVELDIKSFYAHTAARYIHFNHKEFDDGKFSFLLALAYRVPVEHFRFEFGYRFATIPTSSGFLVLENTATLAYFLENAPISFRFDYSHLGLTHPVTIDPQNERDFYLHQFQFLTQFVW